MIEPDRIDIIDGWRAVSIALVVIGHLLGESSIAVPELRSLAAAYSQTGVQFFFGISGFVICSGLLREKERNGAVSVRGFYTRRAFRIFPPLIVYLVAVLLGRDLGLLDVSSTDLIRAATFVCNIGPECSWDLAHTWSLAYEEQFYLIFPCLFLLLGPFRRPALLVLTASTALTILLLYWIRLSPGIVPLRHFYCIACGVIAAMYQKPLTSVLARTPMPVILAIAVLPFTPPWMNWQSRITWFIYLVCVGPAVMIAILGTIAHKTSIFSVAPLPQIGRASYGIYLWQQLATGPYQGAGPFFYIATIAVLAVVVATQYRFIERPLIQIGRRLSQRNSSTALVFTDRTSR